MLYPPTLQSSSPVFSISDSVYQIVFRLQEITRPEDIKHIQIRVAKQSNNKTIGLTPDGILYKTYTHIDDDKEDRVSISLIDDVEPLEAGSIYKIQVRFGSTEAPLNAQGKLITSQFAVWKRDQIENSTFSEWSNVMAIKPITMPDIKILKMNDSDILTDLSPLFQGICTIAAKNRETVDKYKFDLYQNDKLLETSNWLIHNSGTNTLDSYRFKTRLISDEGYTVKYSIITVNGFELSISYSFVASETYISELEGVTLRIDDQDMYCKENGCLRLYVDSQIPFTGCFVVTRASEKDNYTAWEDLKFIVCQNKHFENALFFEDYTIESGIKYKYAIQQERAQKIRTAPIYDEHNSPHYVDFEYSYLYHNNIQLRLMYNHKISTFKHTVLVSKQDTLGDKYPHLVKNGNAYYAEFPISGTISFHSDDDQTFLHLQDRGFYYDDELTIPRDKFEERPLDRVECVPGRDNLGSATGRTDYRNPSIDFNETPNNIFVERKFRETVESFLNNFDYKLYKSPTEGNIPVVLMNISMTPNETLGKMVYDFSATAYEIMDNTIENLDKYGIIHRGSFEDLTELETFDVLGQLQGIYSNANYVWSPSPTFKYIDVFALVKKQEEQDIGGGYKIVLNNLKSFWIEPYPKENLVLDNLPNGDTRILRKPVLDTEQHKLESAIAEAKNKEEPVEDLEKQLSEIMRLQSRVSLAWHPTPLEVIINGGQKMYINPGRIYALDYPITSFSIKCDYPILFNYIATMGQLEENSYNGQITSLKQHTCWGQLNGIFTDNEYILRNGYNANIKDQSSFIVTQKPYQCVIDGKTVLVDTTNYEVYKSLDLNEIIKEQARKEMEELYNIKFEKINDVWQTQTQKGKPTYRFFFSGISTLTIEANENTKLSISKHTDGSNSTLVNVGHQRRYRLKSMDNLIRYLKFEAPAYAIVNYKIQATIMKIEEE